ncbi:hypothetical protein G3435_11900 [Pseudomonas sp. MAFF212428]|uniref:Heme-binding protein n=1 Tax=Pseudomonas brassicae TaxID=2708063 RepID=A0A6B3NRS7_9PSED|nr:heme-binding protein [Pseudomonas brassicae]NER60503.1 hypothetical protein [Pseudomonas brassicae]NER62950.1 hypothetical protein [Pseudomonas brassicae]
MFSRQVLAQADVERMMGNAVATAHANGWAVCIAIVDEGGHLMAFKRLDDAPPSSIAIAIEKAKCAALSRRESKHLEDMINGGRAAFLSTQSLCGMLEGGVPARVDGHVVAAVGVSGVTPEQDARVAHMGVAALVECAA